MATKKFNTEEEYNREVNKIDCSLMYSNILSNYKDHQLLVKHKTSYLIQAAFLIELVQEKINQHNSECKRLVSVMKGKAYKRNNIQNYNG